MIPFQKSSTRKSSQSVRRSTICPLSFLISSRMISLSLINTEDVFNQMRSCGKVQRKGISSICGLHRTYFLALYNDAHADKLATVSKKSVSEQLSNILIPG